MAIHWNIIVAIYAKLIWRVVIFATVLFWLFVAGLGVYRALNAQGRVTISYDLGGTVSQYREAVRNVDYAEILGVCGSACTMYLGARRVCISPDAMLLFHEAHNDDGSRNDLATLWLWDEYPRGVRAWLTAHGGLTHRLIPLSGSEAIRLGVPRCSI